MKTKFTLLIQTDEKTGKLVGQIEEYPAVISEADNINELLTNIADALKLYLDVQRKE